GDHPQTKASIGRYFLMAGHLLGQFSRITGQQTVKLKPFRTARWFLPDKFLFHVALQRYKSGRIADEKIDAGVDILDPMNEQSEMYSRPPGQCVKGELAGAGNRFLQNLVERCCRDAGMTVQSKTAPPLVDDFPE